MGGFGGEIGYWGGKKGVFEGLPGRYVYIFVYLYRPVLKSDCILRWFVNSVSK
jgi:hypothetical protein